MNRERGISSKHRAADGACLKSEGSSPLGRSLFAPQTCIRSVRLDPDHDAVIRIGGEAPGRRAHSRRRHLCHVRCRAPPPRIVNRQCAVNASASAE
jgi:hypothetical protein